MSDKLIGIFIEPRKIIEIFHNINNFFRVLPNYKLYFFCGKDLKPYYDSKFVGYDNLIITDLPVDNLTAIEYSDLLKSATFWEQFDADYCLTIQTDGCLCINSPYTIDYFFKYDFVGGFAKTHWRNQMKSIIDMSTSFPCLNGGFSLRHIPKCIEVINSFPPLATNRKSCEAFEMYPEDLYFAYGMLKLGYNVGVDADAIKFCTHTNYAGPTFCVHKFKKYASEEQYIAFLKYCNQYRFFITHTIDTTDCRVNIEPHLVVLICTYYRKNGKTLDYLHRSIDSVFKQQYTNWTLLIVGDNYEKLDELSLLIEEKKQETSNKIMFVNNTIVERDTIRPNINRKKLWHCAGCNSGNVGLQLIRDGKFKYYTHLDDDDFWDPSHLKVIADAYTENPNCVFVNTKSTHPDLNIIPNITSTETYLNWDIQTNTPRIVHSSLSFRCDILLNNYKTNLKRGIGKPSDHLMIKSIFAFIADNPLYTALCVNKLTCFHDEEMLSICK